MPELEWTVEYETLPPEEDLPPTWEPDEPPPRRRIPGWIWIIVFMIILSAGGLSYLYKLGNEADPLPNPESPEEKLATAVGLELNALSNGDLEIYEKMQDKNTRRTDPQPPPELWFGEQVTGIDRQVELVSLETQEQVGRAKVEFAWNKLDYHMVWYYRLADDLPNSQEPRWVHTDWIEPKLDKLERVSTQHFVIRYYPKDQIQATNLGSQLENYLNNICSMLECPDDMSKINVTMDPGIPHYGVDERKSSPLNYYVSSPQRIRWPANGGPEPLVLGSLGRHLICDLIIRPVYDNLGPQNRLALPMAGYWLAHRLLLLEDLPGTEWLDEATRREDLYTSVGFVLALAANISPQQAVNMVYQPDTASFVTGHKSYFGWLAVVTDPLDQYHNPQGLFYYEQPWKDGLDYHYDAFTDPWSLANTPYMRTAPDIVRILQQDEWVVAVTALDNPWSSTYYFKQTQNGWQLGWPDETFVDEPEFAQSEHIKLYYQPIDAVMIPSLLDLMEDVYQHTVFNFSLNYTAPITAAMLFEVPAAQPSSYEPPVNADIYISPVSISAQDRNDQTAMDLLYVQASFNLISHLLEKRSNLFTEVNEDSVMFVIGLIMWQMETITGLSELAYSDTVSVEELENWRPPPIVDSEEWLPFSKLWPVSDQPQAEEFVVLLLSPRLVFEYLYQQHGREAIPVIVDALFAAESLEEWIQAISDQSVQEFELEWRQWVIDQYQD